MADALDLPVSDEAGELIADLLCATSEDDLALAQAEALTYLRKKHPEAMAIVLALMGEP